MRGGAFFNGKEGRVDFRKNLRVREDWWVFEKTLKVQGRTGGFSKIQGSTFSFSKVQEITFIFSNVKKVLVGFRKTSLALREVFRKPFLSPIS